nr:putative glucose-6-phosphate 1-epimerase isoform X2 [Malus domestica]
MSKLQSERAGDVFRRPGERERERAFWSTVRARMALTWSFSERFEALPRRHICMGVKLHHGKMNMGRICFSLVARYEFRLRVTLGPGGDLMLTSRIRNTNTDGKSFTFTFAYHTYLAVTDISEVRVEGLETLDYLDNLKSKERFTEQGDAITFESEVDKVYLSTPTNIAILDHERKRTFVLRKDRLPDAVVWNPWDKKAKAITDFGDDEYKNMLCVQAACVEKPVVEWKGRPELSAVPSSYCRGQLDPRKVLLGG